MHDNYEVKGRVQRIEQRVQHGAKLRNRFQNFCDFESFDVAFSPSGQVLQKIKYTFDARVHGSELFLYAERGELIRTLGFDGEGSPLRSTDFQYDSEGRYVGWTEYDPSGALTRRCVQRYAGELLISSAVADANGVPIRQEEIEYAGSHRKKSICRYYGLYGPKGIHCETWVTHYDAQGRIIETFGLKPDGFPLGDGRYTYEYDATGRMLKTWSFNHCADDKAPDAVTVFEYKSDEVGNWVERHAFHRFRSQSRWRKTITVRKMTYFPAL